MLINGAIHQRPPTHASRAHLQPRAHAARHLLQLLLLLLLRSGGVGRPQLLEAPPMRGATATATAGGGLPLRLHVGTHRLHAWMPPSPPPSQGIPKIEQRFEAFKGLYNI